ncbi:NAD(P)-binding protein [Dendrothele bispora CBS 962.96]|uniref:NAD(P)-binding protein n=1 Tax=Dendrothele bispora (strain CBS 962.96) TaxID=1314807 RepID=A0A4S8MLA3_DENBC|nr:NAD(P)-binding protein [Dendrothele bispora CBS 962.96]
MKVALAGASAGVGWHIADRILSRGRHELTILSRQSMPEFSSRGAHVKTISYESIDSLVSALSGIHTVISAIGDHSRSSQAQLTLVEAAIKAGVTRFIPSGWSGTDGGPDDIVELYRFKQPTLEALKKSSLEWSHPEMGVIMNYFATPKPGGTSHLKPLKFWIDVENCTAAIPGDGNLKVAYTRVEDVGTFVDKALDYEGKWPETLKIVGALASHNELIKMAEKVRGKPFTVTYLSAEEIRAKLIPNPPVIYVNMANQLSLALLDGRFSFEPNFNEHVKMNFTQPEQFLQEWWGQD